MHNFLAAVPELQTLVRIKYFPFKNNPEFIRALPKDAVRNAYTYAYGQMFNNRNVWSDSELDAMFSNAYYPGKLLERCLEDALIKYEYERLGSD